ncbi:MAG TPA: hypothetical protein VFI71_06710, partial [Pyrinomonadaceae bacterium]|nr:hypothetical protein [Pyrinomonadaceae bacterium]
EDWQLQFRMETFNVFNIQNWDTPAAGNLVLNQNLSSVGRITGLAAGTNPRQIQFGLRLMF